jgi:hypothetical protein
MLLLFSRNITAKDRDLKTYINILTNNLRPKTLVKISHSLNRLIPVDERVINEEIKPYIKKLNNLAIPKEVVKEKLTFAEDMYYKFIARGVVAKQISSILADRQVSVKSDDEVYGSLSKVCRSFDENELVESDYSLVSFSI